MRRASTRRASGDGALCKMARIGRKKAHFSMLLQRCWLGQCNGRLHAEHTLKRADEPADVRADPLGGGWDEINALWGIERYCCGVIRRAGRARLTAITSRGRQHTHVLPGAGPLPARPWLEGLSNHASCMGRGLLSTTATRLWRHTHVPPGAGAPPGDAGKGCCVARAALDELVLPQW